MVCLQYHDNDKLTSTHTLNDIIELHLSLQGERIYVAQVAHGTVGTETYKNILAPGALDFSQSLRYRLFDFRTPKAHQTCVDRFTAKVGLCITSRPAAHTYYH